MKKMQFNGKKNGMKVVMPTGAVVVAVIGIVVACVQPNNRMYNTKLDAADVLTDTSGTTYTPSGSNYTFTGNVSSSYTLVNLREDLGINGDSGTRTVSGTELQEYLGGVSTGTNANDTTQTLSTNDIDFNNVNELTNTNIVINEVKDTSSSTDDDTGNLWTSFTITLIGGDWYGGSPEGYIQFEFDNPNATS